MKSAIALVLAILSGNAYAGFTEFNLLDITECKAFLISTDIPAPEGSSENAWGVAYEQRYESAGRCAEVPNNNWLGSSHSMHRMKSFHCDADPQSPFKKLNCQSSASNPWYAECMMDGKEGHDIRLYWVDSDEYLLGESPAENKGYTRDAAILKKKCPSNK